VLRACLTQRPSQAVRSVALELVGKWAAIVEVDSSKPNGSTAAEQSAGRTSQKSEPASKPSTSTPSAVSGKKQVPVAADKRSSVSGPTATRPAAPGGSGFGTMFGKPGASRQPRQEHAPSTMRMNPLPRPEVDDQEDDGGESSSLPSSGRVPPRNPTPPSSAAAPKLQPLALPDAKRPAPAPPPAAKSDASASSRIGSASSSAGSKRPLDALRLPTAQAPSAAPLTGPGKSEEREDRPGLAKRRRRGTGPLSVSWAVQLTDVREYIPNPEEWGRSPRHLHGDEFSDAVRPDDTLAHGSFGVQLHCAWFSDDGTFFFQVRQEKLNERGKLSLDDPLLEDEMGDPIASPTAHPAFDSASPTAASGGSGRESSGVRLVWTAKSATRVDPAVQQRARAARCGAPACLSVSFPGACPI
jgi:hypothetical protein